MAITSHVSDRRDPPLSLRNGPGATPSEKRERRTSTPKGRLCACGMSVVPNNYARHRRGDACSSRPLPCPERCDCGRTWPCDECELGPLIARVGVERVATAVGLSVRTVRRLWRAWRRRRAGPLRIRTKRQVARWGHLESVRLRVVMSRARIT